METINDILGYKKLKIYQNSDMFQFSLDSVLLPNFVTINKNAKKILDIGTGNAIIPIILTTKTNAEITAIEIQKDVCELAKKSVKLNCLDSQIKVIHNDVNQYYLECNSEEYDIITCNPPYFKVAETSKLNDSEYKIIARHEIKLDLEGLMKISSKLLKNKGIIGIVHRPDRLIDIIMTMKKYNIEPKKIRFVYPKQTKEANILLIEGKKNGNPGLKILKPLYSHLDNGDYTLEIQKYFE